MRRRLNGRDPSASSLPRDDSLCESAARRCRGVPPLDTGAAHEMLPWPDPVKEPLGNRETFGAASAPETVRPMETESELIGQCQSGKTGAWDALFDKYYGVVARFVFQLSGDFTHEDTEEICQETFLALVRSLNAFQSKSSFQTWLLRIAANKAMDFRDKNKAAKRGGHSIHLSLDGGHHPGDQPVDLPSGRPGPDGALLQNETCLLVRQALDRVGEPCREILELRYYGDLSYAEIAAELALNPKTVSSRLSKCLDRMAALAKESFPTPQSFAV